MFEVRSSCFLVNRLCPLLRDSMCCVRHPSVLILTRRKSKQLAGHCEMFETPSLYPFQRPKRAFQNDKKFGILSTHKVIVRRIPSDPFPPLMAHALFPSKRWMRQFPGFFIAHLRKWPMRPCEDAILFPSLAEFVRREFFPLGTEQHVLHQYH